jgi:hypothetical protein
MQWPLPSSACPRHQAPIHAGPRAPAAAATERASSSHPTPSSTWSVPPPSSYASSSSTAAMLTYGSSPFDFIRSSFRRVAMRRMGKLAWSRGAADVAVGERPGHDELAVQSHLDRKKVSLSPALLLCCSSTYPCTLFCSTTYPLHLCYAIVIPFKCCDYTTRCCIWRCCPGAGNGRRTRGGREGVSSPGRVGRKVASRPPNDAPQKVPFFPALMCAIA